LVPQIESLKSTVQGLKSAIENLSQNIQGFVDSEVQLTPGHCVLLPVCSCMLFPSSG
jgi:hypothetical protein